MSTKLTITVSDFVYEQLSDLHKKVSCNKSEIIEEIIRLGLTEYNKRSQDE